MSKATGNRIRRAVVGVLGACLVVPGTAVAGHGLRLDHPVPFNPGPPRPMTAISGGEGAQWEFIASLPTGNPHSDLDFFTRGGNVFASVGTLAIGPNAGGQTIVQLTDGDEVRPRVLYSHPSASCVSNPSAALGLQHDVEATPKGNAIQNVDVLAAVREETQLLIDATDAEGRCHDQGALGLAQAPQGGLEILDVTDSSKPPVVIGLTSHIGEAHTVNIDPKRPHIAYAVTSDAVGVNAQGQRNNENATDAMGQPNADRFDLDGFEVVDLSSCMNFPAGTTVQQKRDACRPQVFRYRYPSIDIAQGHTNKTGGNGVFGCHELELYPDDRLTCGGGNAAILFDMKGAFDDRGTPADFRDDKPRGTALPCRVRNSSTAGPVGTGAKVTDCVTSMTDSEFLTIPKWLQQGAPSLQGVQHLGSAFHAGREATADAANPDFDSTEDIDFDHELEFSNSGDFLLATDERGGGVVPPGASCNPQGGPDVPVGNGGVHAYRVDRLLTRRPRDAADAHSSYARNSKGEKAIIRVPIRTPRPQATICTAHVFQQIPGQNRIFMGWYSQGTQVIDFIENADGTIDFKNTGFFIPTNADQWVSHVFKVQANPDGSFTYFGAAGDFALTDGGRNAIEVYKVTLPPPPSPRGRLAGTGAGFQPVVPTTPVTEPPPGSSLSCVPQSAKLTRTRFGPFTIGATRQETLDRTPRFARQARGNRILRYCAQGGGRVSVVFGRGPRASFVATNARRPRGVRGLRRGDSTRKVSRKYGRLRRIGPGLFASRNSKTRTFGIRAGKLRYVAVIDPRVQRSYAKVRREIKRAGFQGQ